MKIRQVAKKKVQGGTFFGALNFFLFFLVILAAVALGAAYAYRDHLLLEFVRQQGPAAFGVEVLAVDSIVTRPVGQASVELRGLVFQTSKTAPTLRAEKILLSTPNTLLDLYQLTFTRNVLNLKAQFIGLQIDATTKKLKAPAPANPLPQTETGSKGLPFPIDLETELRDAQLDFGPQTKPVKITNLTGIIRTQISTNAPAGVVDVKSTGQLALGIAVGGQTTLPLRTEWSLSAEPKLSMPTDVSLAIQSLTISTLGLSLKSSGTLRWPEQIVTIEASGSTTDLGVLPLDKAESEALGISGRLKGAADVSIKVTGDLKSVVTTEGLIRVKGGEFPFTLEKKLPRPFSIRGPVQLDLEAPFKISYDLANAKFKTLDLQLASVRTDFTAAEVRIDRLLRKPAQLMMSASAQVTAEGETIDVSNFDFRLANLLMAWKGQISLEPLRTSKLDLQLTLPNLSGWPALLPILGNLERTATETSEDINRAKGSIGLKAKIELPLANFDSIATDSRVDFDLIELSDLDLPVNLTSEKNNFSAAGRMRAQLTAVGNLAFTKNVNSPIAWSLKRAAGSIDARDLAFSWQDKLQKKVGQELLASFVASAPSTNNLKFEKSDFRVLDSNLGLTGTVGREENGNFSVDAAITSRLALSQMYEIAPILRPLRAKIPSGTVGAQVKLVGRYDVATGPSGSPLTASGRLTLKSPGAVVLATAKIEEELKSSKVDETEPSTSILNWPIFAKSNLAFDVQFDAVTMKTRALKTVSVLAALNEGGLKGTASIENAFGGPVKVTSFTVNNLAKKKLEELKVSINGNYKSLNLATLAEFASPKWKNLIAGLATGDIALTALPFSNRDLIETATASGTVNIKQGSFSTAPIDQLVTLKLFEYPVIAKLIGQKPKLTAQTVNLALSSNYSLSEGRMNLKRFTAVSPEKNEIGLEGWIQKDFKIDLKGVAHLADIGIGGSFRQANSDAMGRLVVPIHLTGSLKEPSLGIAEETISEMTKKTVALETNKLKTTVKNQAGKVIDQKKKEAVDAVKAELKKRGLSF